MYYGKTICAPNPYRKPDDAQHNFAVDGDSDEVLAAFVGGQLKALDLLVERYYMAGSGELLVLHFNFS